MAEAIAEALVQAQNNMQPARMDVGTTELIGVTHNRRANISPYVKYGTIDPHLGVMRVDTADGKPLATVWNFGVIQSLSLIFQPFMEFVMMRQT